MRKLSNIAAAALLAVGLTSGLGASVAYAASDDTNLDNQILVTSLDENGAGVDLSELTVNNDTLLSSNQGNYAQNGSSIGQIEETYSDTNNDTTGFGVSETLLVNPDTPEVPEPAVTPTGALQVADISTQDEGDLQPSAGQPTIAISGEVTAGAGNVVVTVTNVIQNNWEVQLRVFDASVTHTSHTSGILAGSQQYTTSSGEGAYQYTINCTSSVLTEGSKLVAFLIMGNAKQSEDMVIIQARNNVPATVVWDTNAPTQIDTLTSEISVVFNAGTTQSPRTYEVLVSPNQTIFTGETSEPVGTRIAWGSVSEDGALTIPVSLGAYGNDYIDVLFVVPSFESVGIAAYAHTGAKRIVSPNDSAQISVSYDEANDTYTLTGSVSSASLADDAYSYEWLSPSDEPLGTETTLTGVAESGLNGLHLRVSVPAASVTLPEKYVSATVPVWPDSAVVTVEKTAAGIITASWAAIGRAFSGEMVQLAPSFYQVQLKSGNEVVATKEVTDTSATFDNLTEGSYYIAVTPKNNTVGYGGERTSEVIEIQSSQDDPVIVDPDPIVYTVTSLDDWTKSSGEDMMFHGEGTLATFTGATLDNVALDEANYTLASGSTLLTLAASYLETLTVGSHTLGMRWEDGSGSKSFTIAAAAVTPDPDPEPVVDPTVDPDPEPTPDDPKKEEAQPTEETKPMPAAETKPAPAAEIVVSENTTTNTTANSTMPQTADPLGALVWMLIALALASIAILANRFCHPEQSEGLSRTGKEK